MTITLSLCVQRACERMWTSETRPTTAVMKTMRNYRKREKDVVLKCKACFRYVLKIASNDYIALRRKVGVG